MIEWFESNPTSICILGHNFIFHFSLCDWDTETLIIFSIIYSFISIKSKCDFHYFYATYTCILWANSNFPLDFYSKYIILILTQLQCWIYYIESTLLHISFLFILLFLIYSVCSRQQSNVKFYKPCVCLPCVFGPILS